MALLSCPQCGKKVSDRAPACPFCKAPLGVSQVVAAAPTGVPAAPESRLAAAPVTGPAAPGTAVPPPPAAAPPRVALAAPYRPGDAIGERYRVLRLLGEGGFGLVYLAARRSGDAVRAVKTVRDELVRDDRARALFRKEAEIWVALGRHPFLVQADEVFEDDGRLFIAMEFVAAPPGGFNSLQEHLQRRPLPLEQALRWAIQACHGMEHAHARGIRCHRDLKPANVLIGPDGNVRVSDFGIAGAAPGGPAMAAPGGDGHTVAGTVFGTPTHMPPEQFEGVERCDARSDVYAFGVVLHQMAAGGALPFVPRVPKGPDAQARLFHELRRLHRDVAPTPLESPLWPVIERCLRKEPAQRFASFAALRAELEGLLAALGAAPVEVPSGEIDPAWELSARAASLSGLDRLDEALACYEQALALRPDEPRLLSARGNVLRRLGRLDAAHASLDRALELAPERDDVWLNKGLACVDAGREDEALRCFDEAVARNPRSNDAWTAKGVMLWRLGRHAEAAAAFDAALAADPRDGRAWSNKAGLLLEAGRLDEALAASARALGLDPRNASYWDGQGTILAALGRIDEALGACDECVRLDPGFGQGWYNRGNALVQAGRYEDALASFARTCELQPEAAVPWYNRALALLVLERPGEALPCLRRYLAQAPAADPLREGAERLAAAVASGEVRSLPRRPQAPGALRNATDTVVDREAAASGVAAAAAQKGPKVLAAAGEIPEAPPGYVHRPGPEVPRHPSTADVGVRSHATGELNGRGTTLYGEQRYAEALACFEKALALHPFHARAHGNRANALFSLGRREEALQAVRAALAIDPGLAIFWHSKAHVELALGQAPLASTSFREFVALAQGGDLAGLVQDARVQLDRLAAKKVPPAPRDALAWAAAGCRHGADGRLREAIEAFDRGLRLDPRMAMLWTLRGEAQNGGGDWDEAIESYEKAIALEPRDARAWHGKGMALARHRRFDEALAAFDEALRQDPDHAATWADRGRYLGAMDRHEESIASIECASLLAPDNPAPWWNRALSEDRLGWLPEAARSYRRFLERAGPGQEAQIETARDRLAVLPPPAPDPPTLAAKLRRNPPPATPAPDPVAPAPAPRPAPGSPAAIASAVLAGVATSASPAAAASAGRGNAAAARQTGDRERAAALLREHLEREADDGAAWLELADDLQALGRLDEALAALDKAQPLCADAGPVLGARGRLLMQMGRARDALLPLQMASLLSDAVDVWLPLGHAYAAAGQHEKALLVLDGVPGGDGEPAVQEARASCLLRLRRPAEGLAAAERALELSAQGRAHAWYLKGNALSDLGRPPESVAAYDRAIALEPDKANAWFNKAHELFHALQRPADALPCCVRARELHSGFNEAALLEARCLDALGRAEEALAACDVALRIEPGFAPALQEKGRLLTRARRFDDALACFDAVLAAHPGDLAALLARGDCLEGAGRPADAAAAIARFLTLAPAADPRVAPLRARVQALRGQAQDAALRPGAAAAPPPDPAAARAAAAESLKKAKFCLGQGQRDKALEWFEAVLRAEPAHADALAGKGECLFFFRRAAEALACFEGAIGVRPQHGRLWQQKGACLEALGRGEEALAAFERAAECDPQSPALWTSRGIALFALGRVDEALASHEKALAIEPRSPLPKLELGKVLERLGRRDEAARAYQQFLSLAPITMQAQVQEARARLQVLRGGA